MIRLSRRPGELGNDGRLLVPLLGERFLQPVGEDRPHGLTQQRGWRANAACCRAPDA